MARKSVVSVPKRRNCLVSVFFRKPVLDKHLNQEHKDEVKSILESYNNEENFPCYICKYVAFSIDDLRDHRFRRHIKFNHLGNMILF